MLKARDVIRGVRTIMAGMLIPAAAALVGVVLTYPLGKYDCYKYGQNKEIPTKYSYFECYVKDKHRGWMTKQEFQSAVVGARLILEKVND